MKRKHKTVFLAITVASLALAGFTYNRKSPTFVENAYGTVVTPVQSLSIRISEKVMNVVNYFRGISSLNKENAALKADLLDARAELSRLKLIENENARLENMVGLENRYSSYPTTAARVIAKDPGNWFKSFVIDKGTSSGLEKNMVVMNEDGLVGKISECGYNYSKVISIIDDTDAVSAESVRTGDIGYVSADFTDEAKCRMQYSETNSDMLEGDEIVTSHMSGIFPPGISIGHIERLDTDEKNGMHYALIEPSVDFSSLKYVIVLSTSFEKELIENTTSDTEE